MDFYSQIGQDRLVLKYLKNKKNGTFVDIGCGFPKYINNTYLLETEFDWNGVSVDLIMYTEQDGLTWNDCRKTKLVSDCKSRTWQLFQSNWNISVLPSSSLIAFSNNSAKKKAAQVFIWSVPICL